MDVPVRKREWYPSFGLVWVTGFSLNEHEYRGQPERRKPLHKDLTSHKPLSHIFSRFASMRTLSRIPKTQSVFLLNSSGFDQHYSTLLGLPFHFLLKWRHQLFIFQDAAWGPHLHLLFCFVWLLCLFVIGLKATCLIYQCASFLLLSDPQWFLMEWFLDQTSFVFQLQTECVPHRRYFLKVGSKVSTLFFFFTATHQILNYP